MVSSNNVGKSPPWGLRLCDVDIQRRYFAAARLYETGFGFITSAGFAELDEAIEGGYFADADKILRRWGVR